jgi:hypothetical protein
MKVAAEIGVAALFVLLAVVCGIAWLIGKLVWGARE